MFSASRRTQVLGLLAVVIIAAGAVVLELSAGGSSGPSYYLALGDSLSVGIQPTAQGQQLITEQGYVTDLYAHYAAEIPQLKLKELGCPGDDTGNVISGQGNAAAARVYHCDRDGGSQLNAAVAFIRAHAGHVKLISIDIGTNDVSDCLDPAVYEHGLKYTIACITHGEQSIAVNLPKILAVLKRAAAPGTELVGGDIYDPFLAGLLTRNKLVDMISTQSVRLITKVNAEIAYADASAGFRTADVADAFFTYDGSKVRAPADGGTVPRDLVVLCSYTWVCAKAPRGPNIHPNPTGYSVMARAFEQVLPKTL
jgi:lysophospholipase L1-like esterase